MGRKPRLSEDGLNKGAWTPLENEMLAEYVKIHGEGKWSNIVKQTGLKRCGKSCRLRWMNYLRPGVKRGNISDDEEDLIIRLHKLLGNRWSLIAGRLPGRTDNEIKNYWHTNIAKKAAAPHSQPRRQPRSVDRKQVAPAGSENGAETSSNFKNHQTIESQCCTPGVAAPTTALQENSMAQDLVGTLSMAPSNTHHENGSSRKGLASGDDDNLSNILTDFHYMEDFYKILDSDYPKLNDINYITGTASHHSNNTIQVDDDDYSMSINGCNPREIAEFSEKLMEADWTSNNCVQPDQGFDFMSFLSFLDSTDQ